MMSFEVWNLRLVDDRYSEFISSGLNINAYETQSEDWFN